MFFKSLAYIFLCVPTVSYVWHLIKGIDYNQSPYLSLSVVMIICAMAICETIERVHNKK